MMKQNKWIAIGFLAILASIMPAAQQPIVIPDGEWLLLCNGGGRPAVHIVDNLIVSCNVDGTATALPFTATPSPSRTPTRTAAPPTVTLTHPASPTVSQTAIVPTATRSATPPVQPPSPTSSGNVVPFKTAPECLDSNGDGHADVTDSNDFGSRPDNTIYHDVWDERAGCHYDHTHNDNPALADSIFGTAGREWSQSISYPFMTTNENSAVGHTGYKYYVNLNPQPACANDAFEYLGSVNCVTAFRIQYHDVGGNAHMVKRFHSYYLEAQLSNGGIVRTGGWADFGCLHGEYKKFFVTLPGIDPTNSSGQSVCQSGVPNAQNINSDPYRAVGYSPNEVVSRSQQGRDNPWGWTSVPTYGWNQIGFFFFRTLDSAGIFDPASPYTERLICPDFKCKYNNSEHHMYSVHVIVPASLDTNGDGLVTYTGYTDRKGTIVQGCTAPSLDCVPLQIVNAPVGRGLWARNTAGIRPSGEPIRDHDIYFNGVPSGWIEIPVMP